MEDKKLFIGIGIFTVLIFILAVALFKFLPSRARMAKNSDAKIEFTETKFSFGDIPYSGGNAQHVFKVKNTGYGPLTLANFSTSCMCTKVLFQGTGGKSPEFGMKGMSQPSSWKGSLTPGESGEVVVIFDPTAHGPQGVGPISRVVSFETSDPNQPYVEFAFDGTVVK
ncbi:MAG: DUF1573 domain-containing protein [Candidatus Blackburnbacteria bacterium]|nr:DUF1573 domain-containing protein [Candidatus Blackburnbacteria bacterium]